MRVYFAVLGLMLIISFNPRRLQDHRNPDSVAERAAPIREEGVMPPDLNVSLHLPTSENDLRLPAAVAVNSLPKPVRLIFPTTAKAASKPAAPQAEISAPAQLWQQWQDLMLRSELQNIPILSAQIAESLRNNPDPGIYQSIADWLRQPNLPLKNKSLLLDLLDEIATAESLEQLLNLVNSVEDSSLYLLIVQAIARIGENRWDGRFHEELSPILEAVWSNPATTDPELLDAIGKAIAEIGAPQGVDALLAALTLAADNAQNKNKKDETERTKQKIAFNAVPEVSNPAATDVLSERFAQEPLGSPGFEASSTALANIGTPEAAEIIAEWAQNAPDEAARNLQDLLTRIDEPAAAAVIGSLDASYQSLEIENVVKSFVNSLSIADPSSITAAVASDNSIALIPAP